MGLSSQIMTEMLSPMMAWEPPGYLFLPALEHELQQLQALGCQRTQCFTFLCNPAIPPGEVHFVDPKRGIVGKITNVKE